MINLDNEVIGKLIKKLRNDAGMSTAELAAELGVSKVIVNQWENGNKGCSVTNLCKLAEIFHVSVQELVEGKLHNEGTIDYLERNFDLSCFNLDELIEKKNESGLEEYLRRCLSIKYRFFYGLLIKWIKDELTEGQKQEFNYIKKYISFDTRLFNGKYKPDYHAIFDTGEDISLKECTKEFLSNIDDLSEDARAWEIDKLVNLNFDIRIADILSLGFEGCSTYALYLCNQQYKDELLALNINGKTAEELGGNEAIGAIITCGGNCVYRFMGFVSEIWDDEEFAKIQGPVVEDEERTASWERCLRPGYNLGGKTQIYDYVDEWKTMSYEEYQSTIMKKKTSYIEDLCTLKYYNPKRYYQLMKSGKYDTYLR